MKFTADIRGIRNCVLWYCMSLCTATEASAHHSPALYDVQRTVALSGTVTGYEWGNPHVYVHLSVAGDTGSVLVRSTISNGAVIASIFS